MCLFMCICGCVVGIAVNLILCLHVKIKMGYRKNLTDRTWPLRFDLLLGFCHF